MGLKILRFSGLGCGFNFAWVLMVLGSVLMLQGVAERVDMVFNA